MAALAFAPSVSPPWNLDSPTASASLGSHFVPKLRLSVNTRKRYIKKPAVSTSCSASPHKIICDPRLDKHVVKQKKMRFVQKLKTLLVSKPKHFMPIQILYKCRGYLSLPKPHSILPMIRRYPTVFELFYIPTSPTPTTNDEECNGSIMDDLQKPGGTLFYTDSDSDSDSELEEEDNSFEDSRLFRFVFLDT